MSQSLNTLDDMLKKLSRLPGLGPRSGRRLGLYLLKNRDQVLRPLMTSLQNADQHVGACEACGNLDETNPCRICIDPSRHQKSLCIVQDVADLWALERTALYQGLYHVLGGCLSAIDGIGPDDLNLQGLLNRIQKHGIQEVIFALNATIDGQTTAHYVLDYLTPANVKITALALGVPLGGELDYLDEGTLSTALKTRRSV